MRKTYCVLALAGILLLPGQVPANDLDDKIGGYTDDDIQSDHQMGGFNTNITHKIQDAMSDAKVKENANLRRNPGTNGSGGKKDSSSSSSRGSSKDANMNSVVLGAGSNVRGDIIIIDQSKGDKFNLGGK